MNASSTPALEIRHIVKKFRSFALEDVSLTVPAGSVTALIGPNGAGKTTLLQLIFGIGMPDSGQIRAFGHDHLREDVSVKHLAAFAGPEMDFSGWSTVGKALRFLASFRPGWDDTYAAQLLEVFELTSKQAVPLLSFGQRMKLGLVAAMAWHPRLLVLDEPTLGLDPAARHFLLHELLATVTNPERAVLISSHQLADIERYADRVVILQSGRVRLESETDTLVGDFHAVQWNDFSERDWGTVPGVLAARRDGAVWSAILQNSLCTPEQLVSRGASQIQSQPVTLEDLFLALTA